MERPAAGTECYLLASYDSETNERELFIRVYDGTGNFRDYRVDAEDIEIQIMDDKISFYDTPVEGYDGTLDHDSATLGKGKGNGNGRP